MAIPKSPAAPPQNESVQTLLEEGIRAKLHKCAEFANSSESYVVSEARKLLFRKDDDFKMWLQQQIWITDQPQDRGGSFFEAENKT